MNELLKQLAEQANLSDFLAPNQKPRAKDLEKFAELIVQECYSICEDIGDKGLDGHYCADEIKRTFVVK